MDRRDGSDPTLIPSVCSSHVPAADHNGRLISSALVVLRSDSCVAQTDWWVSQHRRGGSSGAVADGMKQERRGSCHRWGGGRRRVKCKWPHAAVLRASPKVNASAATLVDAGGGLDRLCSVTSRRKIWCVSMTTDLMDQTFPVPDNNSPNSSGHFYHLIHPHVKKNRSSQ